jgi:hypothetical protein
MDRNHTDRAQTRELTEAELDIVSGGVCAQGSWGNVTQADMMYAIIINDIAHMNTIIAAATSK